MRAGGFLALNGLALAAAFIAVTGPAAAAPRESLVDAVRQLDHSRIHDLLRRQADVNAREPDGMTPLHWAAHHGAADIAEALIDAGADVAATTRYGVTPIWLAAHDGHAAVVEALLRAGADPDSRRGDTGESVLMIASRGGHTDVIERLIAYDAEVRTADPIRRQTALMWAAAEGHRSALVLLAAAGADLEARSSTGMTPLMFATRSGDIPVTRALLDLGADLAATAPDGTTMLMLSILNAHWEHADFLLERGADPNRSDPLHGSPLHAVAFMRRAQNQSLSTWIPRQSSGAMDSIALAESLLRRGARINERLDWDPYQMPQHMAHHSVWALNSYRGATPFFIASRFCDLEFMKFLVARGADPMLEADGVQPILAAAGVGYAVGESPETPAEALQAVQLLQELGNDVGAVVDLPEEDFQAVRATIIRAWNGATALHGAVLRGGRELVEWLIDAGVPLDQRLQSGETALDMAEGTGLGLSPSVRPDLAAILRAAMTARGLPVATGNDAAQVSPAEAERAQAAREQQ